METSQTSGWTHVSRTGRQFFIHCTIREVPTVINTLKCQFLPYLLTSHRWGTVLLIPRLCQAIHIHKIWCWRCSVGPSAKWKCEAQWDGELSLRFSYASCPNLCLGMLSSWMEVAPPCSPGCPSNVRWCSQSSAGWLSLELLWSEHCSLILPLLGAEDECRVQVSPPSVTWFPLQWST